MKNTIKIILSLTTLLIIIPAMAQGAPPATPIDGGLSVLLLAGGAYGIKKIRDIRKENN
jgi:hypothetical protein